MHILQRIRSKMTSGLLLPARVGPSPRDRELSIDRRRRVARVSRATASSIDRSRRMHRDPPPPPPRFSVFYPGVIHRTSTCYDAVPAAYSITRARSPRARTTTKPRHGRRGHCMRMRTRTPREATRPAVRPACCLGRGRASLQFDRHDGLINSRSTYQAYAGVVVSDRPIGYCMSTVLLVVLSLSLSANPKPGAGRFCKPALGKAGQLSYPKVLAQILTI